MKLRRRLTLTVVGTSVLVAATLSAIGYATVSYTLHQDADRVLRIQAGTVRESLAANGTLLPPSSRGSKQDGRRDGIRPFGRGLFIAQANAKGVQLTTPSLSQLGQLPQPAGGRTGYRNITFDSELYRVYSVRSGPYLVQVARQMGDTERFLKRLRRILALAALFAVVATFVLSRWVARASLAPVNNMTNDAREIRRTGDLRRRVDPAYKDPEIVELSDAVNEMLDSIEQASASQRQFVADASHELRTPLTSLQGNAGFIARAAAASDPDVAEAAQALGRDVQRLVAVADGLTVLARLDARPPLQLEPVDVDRVACDAIERARTMWPDHTFQMEGRIGTQLLDEELVRRIFANLLDNAGRYTPPGTTVDLAMAEANGRPAFVRVSDDGPGMSADDRTLAFNRFHRGDTSGGTAGTGLGLAIVAEASQRLGGSARLEEGPAGGLSCVVELGPPDA